MSMTMRLETTLSENQESFVSIASVTQPMTFIARTTDVEPGCALQVNLGGRPPLALVRLDNEFFVINDTCTHGEASLSDGEIVNGDIECPFHSGCFDIRTGAVTAFPCAKALTVYPVKVEDDQVFAALDAGTCADTPV
jgi:nitrite reductase/ring-hydroxylating ferredoxin subunit